MKTLRNINELFKKVEIIVGTTALLVIFFLTSINIVKRYFFHSGWSWSGELIGFIYAWVAFIAAAYTMAEDRHVRITLLSDRFGPKLDHIIRLATDSFAVVGLIWMCFPTMSALSSMTYTAALRWPKGAVYSGLMVGFILYIIHFSIQIVRHIVYICKGIDIMASEEPEENK